MSNEGMRPLRRKHKVLAFLAIAVLGLLLAPFVAVQIQERIFRHRAEQLLADMRLLMTHRASWAEIQAVFKRWDPQGTPCSGGFCSLEGDSSDLRLIGNSMMGPAESLSPKPWLWPFLYRIIGGRLVHIFATARAEASRLPSIHVGLMLGTSRRQAFPDYQLAGAVSSGTKFSVLDVWWGLTLHSNYIIADQWPRWHPGKAIVQAMFGPAADPTDIDRLMNFNLSCLTRWVPCGRPEELMPTVSAQDTSEEPHLNSARMDHVCGPYIIALMARDAQYTGMVEISGVRITQPERNGGKHFMTVRMIRRLNAGNDWKTGESREVEIYDANTYLNATSFPPEVRTGNRFIILADSAFSGGDFYIERCGAVPLSPANLELVQNAIAGNLPPAKP